MDSSTLALPLCLTVSALSRDAVTMTDASLAGRVIVSIARVLWNRWPSGDCKLDYLVKLSRSVHVRVLLNKVASTILSDKEIGTLQHPGHGQS